MSSVTARINEIKQPRGGYIKPSEFETIQLSDNKELGEENLHASVIGLTVDYLTRFMMLKETNPSDIKGAFKSAFQISITGYLLKIKLLGDKELENDQINGVDILSLVYSIKGLDDKSIISACKATTYDVWYRNPMCAMGCRGAIDTNPDKQTIENIRIMVNRSLEFLKQYGPITVDGFTFEDDGYTETVDSGDGDYLTSDTLWDFKVSKDKLKNKQTLQLLMYWIMGQHSKKPEFKGIKKLGIYNPRLNIVYLYDLKKISKEVIKDIEDNVICY